MPEAFTKSSSPFAPIFKPLSYDLFSILTLNSTYNQVARYTDKDLQKDIKLLLDFFFHSQRHGQTQAAAI